MKTTLNFRCPLCNTDLIQQLGNIIHPGDSKYGVSLHCPSSQCPAQEVAGHGDTAKAAFEIILSRFKTSIKKEEFFGNFEKGK